MGNGSQCLEWPKKLWLSFKMEQTNLYIKNKEQKISSVFLQVQYTFFRGQHIELMLSDKTVFLHVKNSN